MILYRANFFRWLLFGMLSLVFVVLSACTKNPDEALTSALLNADIDQVNRALQRGADPNTVIRYGITPLMLAVDKNNLEIVTVLLDHGANVNALNDFGETALRSAVKHKGRAPMIRLLVEHGADVSIIPKDSTSYLSWAKRNKDAEAIEILTHAETRAALPNSNP